ncbi:MAG: hypothetical protein IT198_12275 [Acidimicrobiia bacterium]|nr:hypothetical protein [Acidimicrobiia bacterium]
MLEFVVLLVGIVVPLVHLLVGVVDVYGTAAAVEAAAQHAARAGVVAPGAAWHDAARDAAGRVLRGREAAVAVSDGDGNGLLGRGEYLDVTVTATRFPLPPLPWSVHIRSRGVARADPCRSLPGVATHVEVAPPPPAPGCPE